MIIPTVSLPHYPARPCRPQGGFGLVIMMLMMVNLLKILKIISRKYQANHPVHIMDTTGNVSPSAFIPFCAWAGDMDVLGTRVPNFSVPVCNAFRPR